MRFFSIYDLILSKAKNKNMTTDEMLSFFSSRKISKAALISLQQTSFLPDAPAFKGAVTEFLEMSELEIELAMGYIPAEYQESYYENLSHIAALLQKSADNIAPKVFKPFFQTDLGELYNGDCIEIMKGLPDNHIDLVFADPPFNLGKTYDPGIDDNMTMSEYINWTYEWLDQCIRILKPGGRIFIYNLPKWCIYIADYLGKRLTFWDWIAVDMKFSLPIQGRLYPAHYALVSYVKGVKAATFNNQRIPMQLCRHCGGEIKDYGGYKSKMNPAGINVSDVWSDIYPVRHKSSKKGAYNELSVKLMDRIISMSTNTGDVVFDPFGGSGTTFAVAQLLKRRWIGSELGNCEIIKQRILNPEQDRAQLNKVYQEKNHLFTEESKKIRQKNGYWLLEE